MTADVILVGTAHVIDLGEALRAALEARRPRGIAVELDPERAELLLRPEGRSGTPRPARRAPAMVRFWSILQRRLGAELGQGAGAEMRAAAGLAREWGLPLYLVDDPIRQTVVRLLRSLTPVERVRLLAGSILGLFVPSRVVKTQIDRYSSAPTDFLDAMRELLPGATRVLLDERNEHMADRLAAVRLTGVAPIAAVVGDAHLPGLSASLGRRGLTVESIPFSTLRSVKASPAAGPPPPPGGTPR